MTAADEWTRAQCAAFWKIEPDTWSGYVTRDLAPKPTRRVGRTPLWDADAVRAWNRPGSGARTDLNGRPAPADVPPLARAIHGRSLIIGDRAFMAIHVDGYAHIDLLTRREPRFATDADPDRPVEWVQVQRYVTDNVIFDAAARERFDAWVERDLRAELEKPGAYLQTY